MANGVLDIQFPHELSVAGLEVLGCRAARRRPASA